MSFFERYKTGYLLRIKLTPSAGENFVGRGVCCCSDNKEYLKASVVSVPEKGKANKELLKILSKKLHIAKSLLNIISGETEHWKKIYIDVEQKNDFEEKLNLLKKEK